MIGRIAKGMLVAAAITPLLGGCVVYSNEAGETSNVTVKVTDKDATPPESLRAVRFDGGALVVRVDSNGCTEASDFEIAVAEGTPTELTLTRKEPDLCKALVADGVELRWTYEQLGLAAGSNASIGNPLRL